MYQFNNYFHIIQIHISFYHLIKLIFLSSCFITFLLFRSLSLLLLHRGVHSLSPFGVPPLFSFQGVAACVVSGTVVTCFPLLLSAACSYFIDLSVLILTGSIGGFPPMLPVIVCVIIKSSRIGDKEYDELNKTNA